MTGSSLRTPPGITPKVLAGKPESVKISDIPDQTLYERRRAELYPYGDPVSPLPAGFPKRTSSAADWSRQNIKVQDFVVQLSSEDVQEVDDALHRLKASRLSVNDINKDTFVLQHLGPKLSAAASEVTSGRGIVILRGLEPQSRCLEDNILIYAGIASYFGDTRGVQGRGRNFLIHLRDAGSSHVPDHLRPSPFANQFQSFHTDFCDVIGMYVIQTAAKGGRSHWASCTQIYNELAATRPHLIKILTDHKWPFQSSLHGPDVRPRPILFKLKHSDQPYFCYSRTNLTGTPEVPRLAGPLQLTNEQADALDAVHFAAEKHAITAQLKPGDIYFLNNHLVLHGREAFEDSGEKNSSRSSNKSVRDSNSPGASSEGSDSDNSTSPPARERHIMRLWLRNPEARPEDDIPDTLRPRWNEVFGEESLKAGVWAFDKVHDENMIIAGRNDEISSFS